jgi:hypothetical protein
LAVPPPDGLRAKQERELTAAHSLAAMEFALADEAYHIVLALRDAGLELDPLTLVALRVLEACVENDVEPVDFVQMLVDRGSLARSVGLAEDRLERDAA